MKKSIYIKLFSILFLGLMFTSCDQDQDLEEIPRENSSKAVIKEASVTVTEGNSPSFTIVQENLVEERFDAQEFFAWVSGQIGVRVVGGTAIEGQDFVFNVPTIHQVSVFLLQDGYYYGYDASVNLEHVVNNLITIVDDGNAEGEETIELQFFPVGLAGVLINDTLTVTIND
ncbi:lipoprotein precursor [Tenacibaculum sp. 190130A14a]|uniref:DUF4382 domain-containing protein n=1 Tax=Tenacibaculum polynesiense TaxID=3137857 RepID=A0ABP1EW62_9FLAO